ncbi:SDR family NAD(P)-dependent oxidoreductase [Paenibacillus sp. Dod16]|uniref:SDR family NAD(P)-dependent oxidoreductase n=1 Tax=Paenibacillus sp. Dod16 TaxID=3416392 RepID=UPI003CED0C4A
MIHLPNNMLEGNNAVVTGAGSGIGRAIAIRLASEGYYVFLVGSREQPLMETKQIISNQGGSAELIVADLSLEEGINKVEYTVAKRFPQLNVLVNNAAMIESGDYRDFTHDVVMKMFSLNTVAPFVLTNSLLNLLEAAGKADVINISSETSIRPHGSNIVYGATKSALEYISRSFAQSLSSKKIKFNVISPGAVDTQMLRDLLNGSQFSPPVGRLLAPEELSEWVMNVIHSDVITGSTIIVDGGTSLISN